MLLIIIVLAVLASAALQILLYVWILRDREGQAAPSSTRKPVAPVIARPRPRDWAGCEAS
jgi:flagellar basal body-associated protein FliL